MMVPVLIAALSGLNGSWSVDLRLNASAPAYSQPMELEIGADGAVTGSFYNTAIEAGRAADSNGRTCFAFTTRDGSGPYQHSGCLRGEVVEGQSWSTGRNFLLNWRAQRASTPQAGRRP